MVEADPSIGTPLVQGLPYLRAEAVYAARYEMAQTLEDVLNRRTRATLLDQEATSEAAGNVAELVGPELGWTPAETDRQVGDFRSTVEADRATADLDRIRAGSRVG
jgi:glycerol-3-phosphate dehydrogenase